MDEEEKLLREIFFPHTRIYDPELTKEERQFLYFMEKAGRVKTGNETVYLSARDKDFRLFFWELIPQKTEQSQRVDSEEDEIYSEELWEAVEKYRSDKNEE